MEVGSRLGEERVKEREERKGELKKKEKKKKREKRERREERGKRKEEREKERKKISQVQRVFRYATIIRLRFCINQSKILIFNFYNYKNCLKFVNLIK